MNREKEYTLDLIYTYAKEKYEQKDYAKAYLLFRKIIESGIFDLNDFILTCKVAKEAKEEADLVRLCLDSNYDLAYYISNIPKSLIEEKETLNEEEREEIYYIIKYLQDGKLEVAYNLIRKYLIKIDRLNCDGFIINLIKLAIGENDLSFQSVKEMLIKLEQKDYEVNILKYLYDYFTLVKSFSDRKKEIYLNLIDSLPGMEEYDLKEYYSKRKEKTLVR